MGTSISLDADLEGKLVDAKQFRGMIRSLLYLTSSRLDCRRRFLTSCWVNFTSTPMPKFLMKSRIIWSNYDQD